MIGSPKSLACENYAAETWTRFQDIPALQAPHLKFIHGSVRTVDCAAKIAHILDTETQSHRTESYDYLIASSGLRRVFPTVPQSLRRKDFLEEAQQHARIVKDAQEGVAVIGGGIYCFQVVHCSSIADILTAMTQVRLAWKWQRS